MKLCLNGNFIDEKKARISPLDNGFLYGDGFYDTMRSYDGKILEIDTHIKRIKKSAKIIGIELPWTGAIIKKWLKKMISINKLGAARVRVTVTRGLQGFDFLHCRNATLLISAEKLNIDPAIYVKGVKALTVRISRPLPEIKMIGLTTMIQAYRSVIPRGAYEAILTDEKGKVYEGASTNIFIVKGGKLYTPKYGLLQGVTRARVIHLAKRSGLSVVERNFSIQHLLGGDEVFLTNRPREIIPVSQINGQRIGQGKVGVITKKIMDEYQNYIRSYFKKSR